VPAGSFKNGLVSVASKVDGTCTVPHPDATHQEIPKSGMHTVLCDSAWYTPMWARDLFRISPPCFLAECRMRRLNQASFVGCVLCLFYFYGVVFSV